jgi:hypothetical protein
MSIPRLPSLAALIADMKRLMLAIAAALVFGGLAALPLIQAVAQSCNGGQGCG